MDKTENIYQVILHTDIGKRMGKLRISVTKGKIKGMLCLLGKETECEGTVDDKGNCRIKGTLNTLKNRIEYIATGNLLPSELLMTFKYKNKAYRLQGCIEV